MLKDAFVNFQTANTLEFYTVVHAAITNHFGYPIAFAANTRSSSRAIEERHDLFMRECNTSDPAAIYDTFLKQAALDDKPLALTYDGSYLVAEHRRFTASGYAAGGNVIVPWDTYIIPQDYNAPSQGRFYGNVADFAPILGFVRAMSRYLDGYEDAGFFNASRSDPRYPVEPLFVENRSGASVTIRATRTRQDPVVVHIIRSSPADAIRLCCRSIRRRFLERR